MFVCVWASAPFLAFLFCCWSLFAGVDTHFWPGEVHFDSSLSVACF